MRVLLRQMSLDNVEPSNPNLKVFIYNLIYMLSISCSFAQIKELIKGTLTLLSMNTRGERSIKDLVLIWRIRQAETKGVVS